MDISPPPLAAAQAVPSLRLAHVWWSIGFVLVATVLVLSLIPDPPQLKEDPSNWSGHLSAYGVLMAWFARLVPPARRPLAALLLIAMGVGVEFLQGMTGYRSFDPTDMLANSCGVMLGWLASPPRLPSGLVAVERLLLRRPA
ncbi:VanZ family protein [Niveibacterium sp. SC-1]|uniref:VanZ family protein n=1 Tax=Niveibacterium sp. SC-1 TaxID=3135646 RepID=UPI00311D73D2